MQLQFRTLCLFVVGLLIAGCGDGDIGDIGDVKLGMSYDEVRSIMGESIGLRDDKNNETKWFYPSDLIKFIDGRVSKVFRGEYEDWY